MTTLALVLGTSAEHVHAELWEAVRSRIGGASRGSYRFLHDRVQEAAYALVPESQRGREHLRIGRLLVAHTPPEKREETIFEIVNQLNRGATLMTSPDEREQLSRLNLIAGKRAKASAAYAAALKYFVSGAALLPDNAWECCSELTFALELNRAECEFLSGDLVSAEERLSIASPRMPRIWLMRRRSRACESPSIPCSAARDRAVEIGLSYLTKVGIAWSPHPTDQEVVEEHERLWRQLGSRPIESLFDLPLMSDPAIRATIEVLSELQGPAYWTDPNLEHLLLLRMANLEHPARQHRCVGRRLRLPERRGGRAVRPSTQRAIVSACSASISWTRKASIERRPRVYRNVGSLGRALGAALARGSPAAPPSAGRASKTGDLSPTTSCGSTAAC